MKKRRTSNYVLYAALVVFGINLAALSPLVAEVQRNSEPGFNSGFFLSLHFIGFVCVAIAAGMIADRIGKKPVIMAGLLGYGMLLFLLPDIHSNMGRYIIMFLIGGCSGILESINSAFVADNNPDNPDYFVNISHTFFGLGGILGPLLFAFSFMGSHNYKLFYRGLSGCALLVFLWLLLTRFEYNGKRKEQRKEQGQTRAKVNFGGEAVFLLSALGIFCYTGAEVASWSWLSSLLQGQGDFTVMESAYAVSLFWFAMTVGRIICGQRLKKTKIHILIMQMSAFAGITTLLMIVLQGQFMVYVLTILLGLSCSSLFPFLASFGGGRTRLSSGTAFSILLVSGNVGSASIPFIVGEMNASLPEIFSKILLAILFFLSGICIWAASREQREKRV